MSEADKTAVSADIPVTPEDISGFFSAFKNKMDRYSEIENKLFEPMPREEWIGLYRKRSEGMRDFYDENVATLNRLNLLWSAGEDMPDAIADRFFDEIQNLNVDKYDDPFYAVGLLRRLIAHYEKKKDMVRLLHLYNRMGWESSARVRMGYDKELDLPLKAYTSILKYQDQYKNIDDPILRRVFYVAYYNIIDVLPGLGSISLDDTCYYMKELEKLYNSPMVREMDADNQRIDYLLELTRTKWLAFESDLEGTGKEFKKMFARIAQEVYEQQLAAAQGDVLQMDVETVLAYQHLLFIEKKQNLMDTILYIENYYDTKHARLEGSWKDVSEGIGEDYYFETRVPDAMLNQWLTHKGVPENYKKRTAEKLIRMKNDFFNQVSKASYTPFVDASISTWCFVSLRYLSTKEEKEKTLMNQVINRQVSTFFHSHMVQGLTEIFMEEIYARHPGMLVGFRGAKTTEDVIKRKDEFMTFAGKCALFHDIGKNKITNIITTQYRPLTDEEFYLIRRHPELAAETLDEGFKEYRDVILGHHKTYDGQKGYPPSFDNRKSSLRILLDIISICDSLDAATDYLGRNYARQKAPEQVFEEIKRDAGTRYNGELAKLIFEDDEFRTKLTRFLTVEREQRYYDLFENHFKQ